MWFVYVFIAVMIGWAIMATAICRSDDFHHGDSYDT